MCLFSGGSPKAYALIEFEPDGTIIQTNQLFLDVMGFTADELRGKNHRIFVDRAEAASREYEAHWARLRNGKAGTNVYRRFTKSGGK